MLNRLNVLLWVFISFFAFSIISVFAEDRDITVEPRPYKMEDVFKMVEEQEKTNEQAQKNIQKTLVESIKTKGQEGRMGQTPVRRWVSNDGHIVVVGFNNVNIKPLWIIIQDKNSDTCFADKNLDGKADRFIINEESGFNKMAVQKKSITNSLHSFIPLEDMISTVKVEADLMPEKTRVYEFGEDVVMINFETGGVGKLQGEEASDFRKKIQEFFTMIIAKLSGEISRYN